MPTKYSRENFQKDLTNLHKLLNKDTKSKSVSQSGGVKSKKSAKKVAKKVIKKVAKKVAKKVVKRVAKKVDNDKRYFKVVEVNGRKHEMGRYSGLSPQQAAKKAVSRICEAKKMSKDNCSITFSIQETTQGSDKKIYGPYKAKLVKNPKEKWVKLGNAILGKYRVVIKEA